MEQVFIVFAKDKDNPFSGRRVVAVADDELTARMIIAQKKDTFAKTTYVVQEWDVTTGKEDNVK